MMNVDKTTPSVSAGFAPPPPDAGLAKAAKAFEALFTTKLVEQMRTSETQGEGGGAGSGVMDHLMNQSLAGHLSKGRGLGIASFLYRQWTDGGQITDVSSAIVTPAFSRSASPAGPGADVPEYQYDPDSIDDGSRPLREMMPPTGLEPDMPLSQGSSGRWLGAQALSAHGPDRRSEKVLYGRSGRPDSPDGATAISAGTAKRPAPAAEGDLSWT